MGAGGGGAVDGVSVSIARLAAGLALVPVVLEAAAASGVIRFVLFGAGVVGADRREDFQGIAIGIARRTADVAFVPFFLDAATARGVVGCALLGAGGVAHGAVVAGADIQCGVTIGVARRAADGAGIVAADVAAVLTVPVGWLEDRAGGMGVRLGAGGGVDGAVSVCIARQVADGAAVVVVLAAAGAGSVVGRILGAAGGVAVQGGEIDNGPVFIHHMTAGFAVVILRGVGAGAGRSIGVADDMALPADGTAAAAAVIGADEHCVVAVFVAGIAADGADIVVVGIAAGLTVPVGCMELGAGGVGVRSAGCGSCDASARQQADEERQRKQEGSGFLANGCFHGFPSFCSVYKNSLPLFRGKNNYLGA